MRKILFVVDERQMGGVSVLLDDILKRINLKKFNVDVMVLHNNGDYLDDLPEGVDVIYGSPFFEVVDLSLKEVIKTKNIFKIIKKIYLVFLMKTGLIKGKIKKERMKCLSKKYDTEVAFKDGFTALFTAYGDSEKKIHWLHTDYVMHDCTAKYHNLFEKTFPLFDKIIGISHAVVERFNQVYPGIQCEVIYNLIDIAKIKKMGEENDIHLGDGINFVSCGRIHEMKGYDRLINVFHRLDDMGLLKHVSLTIIGDGPDLSKVQNLVQEYGLKDKVKLLGRKKNPYPYVKAADAFLMCSRYEPFGLVVLEAMVLGTPVISTEVASIREIMREDYGIITDNNEEGLINAIAEVIKNPNYLNKYRENLKKYNYDCDKIVKEIEDVLS